jgi:hypothetical protein
LRAPSREDAEPAPLAVDLFTENVTSNQQAPKSLEQKLKDLYRNFIRLAYE